MLVVLYTTLKEELYKNLLPLQDSIPVACKEQIQEVHLDLKLYKSQYALVILYADLLDIALYIWDTRENFHQVDLNVSEEDFCHTLSSYLQKQLASLLVVPHIQILGVSGKGESLVRDWKMHQRVPVK